METLFKEYLVKKGYSLTTPSGNPSTVYSYLKSIDRVCEWEHTTWNQLSSNIGSIVHQYDVGGSKEDLGKLSHSTIINALKRFQEFSMSLRNCR